MAFSSFSSGLGSQPMNDINTTPLVDVMLVLLVIFIITAPLLNQAVPVDLPRVESIAIDQNAKALQLSIDEHGVFFVNGLATQPEAIEQTLREKRPANVKSPELHLRADRQTAYEKVAQAMAAANRAGITKISFVTESPPPVTNSRQPGR
jgi:biopolymer transport protein ExbD